MKATFTRYAKQGLSNELIAMLTGYRKQTVDKYVKENPDALNAWNNVKAYASSQFKAASESVSKKEASKIEEEIASVRKKLCELEAQKASCFVAPFTWGEKKSYKAMNMNAKENLNNLFSDNNWHTLHEVDEVFKAAGYADNIQRSVLLKRFFPSIIREGHKSPRYKLQ
jgi:IS30 family transposase